MKKLLALIALAACGGGGGGGGDDVQPPDAPPNVPAMITVSGTATAQSLQGAMPVEGLTVAAFKATDEATAVVMTTTDAAGMYTLTIPTGGVPVDGFIKGTKAGFADTYLYAPEPLVADFAGGSLNMLTNGNNGNYDLLHTLCQAGAADPTKGLIAVIVQDAAAAPVAGATVDANPAASKTCYSGDQFPDGSKTATNADGLAIMFNTLGNETVSATLTGSTFKSHAVKAFPGSFTTTLIVQ